MEPRMLKVSLRGAYKIESYLLHWVHLFTSLSKESYKLKSNGWATMKHTQALKQTTWLIVVSCKNWYGTLLLEVYALKYPSTNLQIFE